MTNKEKNLLLDFNRRTIELYNESLDFMTGTGFSLSYSETDGTKYSVEVPNDRQIKASALSFRIFYQQTESLYFTKINNLIEKNGFKDSKIINLNREFRSIWISSKESNSSIQLILNDEALDSFDLWLNGEYFHADDEKVQKMSYIRGTPIHEMSKMNFVYKLQNLIKIVCQFNFQVVQKIIDSEEFMA